MLISNQNFFQVISMTDCEIMEVLNESKNDFLISVGPNIKLISKL